MTMKEFRMRKLAHLAAAAVGAAALAVTLTAPVAANAGTSAPASTAQHTAAHRSLQDSANPVLAATQVVILWNDYTGLCVDDSSAYGLRAISCNSLNYQQWAMSYNNGANAYTFKNQHTGRCIDDSSGPGLRAISCNGLNYQQWFLNPALGYTLRDVHTRLCLDDSQYGLRTYTCNGTPGHDNAHQDWSF
jgi:Ricin-type beta-trefoil lectin domain-like